MIDRPPASAGPIGIYLHFPFCAIRCTYCDFATVAGRDERIEAYLEALRAEVRGFQPELPREVDTVFLGGGTPSRMSPGQLERLLAVVADRFRLIDDCEITLECNPESLSEDNLRDYAAAGVSRFSIGVQSLDDAVLKQVGRAHDAARAEEAVRLARAVEGATVNVDLIAGLPGEDLGRWDRALEQVAGWEPDHISLYLLELDKDTPLARSVRSGRTASHDDEVLVAAYVAAVELLESRGFVRYEISNFARPGRTSRHNRKYWTDGWYGAFGLGAHGYAAGARRANTRDLDLYLERNVAGADPLDWHDGWDAVRRLEEALILGLRLADGIDLEALSRRYDTDVRERYAPTWNWAEEAGLLEKADSRLRLTPRGTICSNELFAELLHVEAR